MNAADLFALVCFAVGAAGAALVALHPNILYAAISLVFSLLAVGGLYAVLGADFLAGAQLLIYVGGVVVVILFAIMMSEGIYRARLAENLGKLALPLLGAVVTLFGLIRLLRETLFETVPVLERAATTEPIGQALVGPYALPFQYVSIVLLIGLIGAVVIARPSRKG